MTDDPTRPDDDIVSAVLDGEATPAEADRVRTDPVLAERLAEFAAVRDRVAAVVTPLDDVTREALIAQALADAGGPAAVPADDTVVGLDRAPSRRRELDRRFLFAAAAVIAVLALAGGLLSLGGGDRDAADQASSAGGDPGTEAAADAEVGTIDVPELVLGEIDDPDTLARRVAADTGLGDGDGLDEGVGGDDVAESAPPAALSDEPDAVGGDEAGGRSAEDADESAVRTVEDCTIELIESRPSLIGQLAQGTVTYQGTPAYVFVYNDADLGGALTLVTGRADCSVLAEVPL